MEQKTEEVKLKWPIDKLLEYSKNPRSITKDGFNRLKRQLMNLNGGDPYKPLIITADGIVLAGNMRLKAMRELGFTEAWVSIVSPKDEKEKIEIALSDNDNAGYTDKEILLSLIEEIPELKESDFAVHIDEPESLDDFMKQFEGEDKKKEECICSTCGDKHTK